MITAGVLAIQGDVEAHCAAFERAGASALRVRNVRELEAVDVLVLPGGESTTISKGLDRLSLVEPLRAFAASGRPMLGTCAGAILLARKADNQPVPTLGLVDVVAVRNAYGTQVDSFAAPALPAPGADLEGLRCVFIRAPRLRDAGPGVEVLARVDGDPVLVRDRNVLAATFHPELTDDLRIHQLLLRAASGG
jgi:5'-phosphate synthase pdxT subunit